MKNLATRSVTALALVAALGISTPAVADASSTTSNNTSAASATTTAWTAWHATWVTYINGLKSINSSYRTSMQSARSAFAAAMAVATTKAERQTARANLDTALVAAINTRVVAITAAGVPPTPPAGFNGTAWVTSFQAANIAFRAATIAAQSVYSQALASATTSEQRRAARIVLEGAIGAAMVAHSNALTALGAPPAHPGRASA